MSEASAPVPQVLKAAAQKGHSAVAKKEAGDTIADIAFFTGRCMCAQRPAACSYAQVAAAACASQEQQMTALGADAVPKAQGYSAPRHATVHIMAAKQHVTSELLLHFRVRWPRHALPVPRWLTRGIVRHVVQGPTSTPLLLLETHSCVLTLIRHLCHVIGTSRFVCIGNRLPQRGPEGLAMYAHRAERKGRLPRWGKEKGTA